MSLFVLDTNTLIYFFKGQGGVAARLLEVPPSRVAVPAIVLYELETGVAKSAAPKKRASQLAEFMKWVSVLAFDDAAARESAQIRAHLGAAGEPIGPLDNLIAGTARSVSGTLVTRNTAEFQRVPGLKLDNWY